MSRVIKKGATSQSIYVEILDSTSTTGGRKTGLAFNTSSLTGYYVRNGGSAVAITLATLAAANSAYSSGGFKEVDATNMPGIYRLDVPDAALASGAESVVVTIKGATGAAQVSAEVQLVDNLASDVYTAITANRAEPAQGAPAASTSLLAKVDYLYKAWRNKKTQTATTQSLFADDASTVDHKATVSDDGTTMTVGEVAAGP